MSIHAIKQMFLSLIPQPFVLIPKVNPFPEIFYGFYTFQQKDERYTADLGNYHYGATGVVWGNPGFSEKTLLQMAGLAQILAGTSKDEWQRYEPKEVNAGHRETTVGHNDMLSPYGDDRQDQAMIKRGFNFYYINQNHLNSRRL